MSRLKSKPNPGALIDWSHPWAQGLLGLYACNEGAGRTLYDLAQVGEPLSLQNFGSTNPWSSWGGPSFTTTTTGAMGSILGAQESNLPFTIASGFYLPALPTGETPLIAVMTDNSSNLRVAGMDLFTSGNINFNCNGTIGVQSPANSLVAATYNVAAWTVNFGAQAGWINGQRVATGAQLFNAAWSATSSLVVGSAGFFTGRQSNFVSRWMAWWGRLLSDQELQGIGSSVDSIFDIVKPAVPGWLKATPVVTATRKVRWFPQLQNSAYRRRKVM